MGQRYIERWIDLIFILGIDALDYELVEKLNLNNLKQIEYGKVIVPINEKIGIPSSPEVWASFLIGENILIKFESSSYFINMITKILGIFNIDSDEEFFKKIRGFFVRFGFSSYSRFGYLTRKTFLDITKSKKINTPYYNFDNKTFKLSALFGNNKISLKKAVKEIKLLYESRKKQIFRELDNIGDEDVVFAFMHTADMLQHCSFIRFSEIEQHYIDLDNYVPILKNRLEDSFDEVIFIIVSDHGFDFDKGTHSMRGFYSSNTHLIPKPEKITDFYEIILELVKNANFAGMD